MPTTKYLYHVSDKNTSLIKSNGFCFVFFTSDLQQENEATNMLEKLIDDGMKLDKKETYIISINKKSTIRIPNDAKKIILLGVAPNQVGLNIKPIQNKVIGIGMKQYLYSFSIDEVMNDLQKKKIMWSEIQKMMI